MTFIVMVGTKGIAAVVPMATVTGKGKEHIILLIITNPATAAVRPCQIFHLATQTTVRFVSSALEDFYLGFVSF